MLVLRLMLGLMLGLVLRFRVRLMWFLEITNIILARTLAPHLLTPAHNGNKQLVAKAEVLIAQFIGNSSFIFKVIFIVQNISVKIF